MTNLLNISILKKAKNRENIEKFFFSLYNLI